MIKKFIRMLRRKAKHKIRHIVSEQYVIYKSVKAGIGV